MHPEPRAVFQTLKMKVASAVVITIALSCASFAEPEELATARTRYRQDADVALRPARERYLNSLEQLKKSAELLRDKKASASIEEEIQRMKQASLLWQLAGIWTVTYSNKVIRTYVILPDSTAIWTSENGNALNKKTKLVADGSAFLIEWDDGKIERVSLNGDRMRIEHYNPKSKLAEGARPLMAEGALMPFAK
jgi:hypothetical protein